MDERDGLANVPEIVIRYYMLTCSHSAFSRAGGMPVGTCLSSAFSPLRYGTWAILVRQFPSSVPQLTQGSFVLVF